MCECVRAILAVCMGMCDPGTSVHVCVTSVVRTAVCDYERVLSTCDILWPKGVIFGGIVSAKKDTLKPLTPAPQNVTYLEVGS